MRLSAEYEAEYAELLRQVDAHSKLRGAELCLFWPKIGSLYRGVLLVIGRAVNGWIDKWVPGGDVSPSDLAEMARRTGEGEVKGDQLGWILDR